MVSLMPLLTELLSSQLEKKHSKGRRERSKPQSITQKEKSYFYKPYPACGCHMRTVCPWHFKSKPTQLMDHTDATKPNGYQR